MKAGAAERDVTPPVGFDITHPPRKSIGVHDPLFVRALVLDDEVLHGALFPRREIIVPEPEEVEDVDDCGRVVMARPWYCECGQTNNADWTDCAWCGRDREDVEA